MKNSLHQTEILRPHSDEAFVGATERLCTDMQVGGVLLRGYLDEQTIENLVEFEGKGIAQTDRLQHLAALAAPILGSTPESASFESAHFTEGKFFVFDHLWHLGVTVADPVLRFWTHLRGEVAFSVARSAQFKEMPGGFFRLSTVKELAHAAPKTFLAKPGDVFAFVDLGCEGVTGNSTFHQGRVPPRARDGSRMSIACDLRKNTPM